MMLQSLIRRAGDLLLGTEPRLRALLAQAQLAMMLMVGTACVFGYYVWVGVAPGWPVFWISAAGMGAMALGILALRLGWTQRFADPTLTGAQMASAITCAAAAYAVLGEGRGAVLAMLFVILTFGVFQVTPRALGRLAVYALVAFGGVMFVQMVTSPQTHPPLVELGHFLMLTIMVPGVSVLASRVWRLRARQTQQRNELALALGRIQELATRDELTGLVNRRHMIDLMEQERQRSVRSGRSFCLALLDLDHFKLVNDRYGHAVGDEVLRQFARGVAGGIRVSDVLARWGGEEFVLLLPDTRLSLARTGVERLRELVSQQRVEIDGAAPLRMTVSIGVTEHIAGESVAQALERADQALYEAKAQGRDRSVAA